MLFDNYEFPWWALGVFALVFLCSWLLIFKRACYGFLDPLNTLINPIYSAGITVTYFVVADGVVAFYNMTLVVTQITTALLGIVLGTALAERFGVIKSEPSLSIRMPPCSASAALLVFALSVAVYHSKFGVPFLYDNPLDSKLMYEGGAGAYRRFLETATTLSTIVLTLCAVSTGKAKYAYLAALCVLVCAIYIVSKGAAITKILMIVFILQLYGQVKISRKLYTVLPVGLALSVVVVFLTLKTVLPSVQIGDVANFFGTRILAYGDAFFYLLTDSSLLSKFADESLVAYGIDNLSPFMATTRLIEWSDALSPGGRVYASVTGIYSGVGPNISTAAGSALYLGMGGLLYTLLFTMVVVLARHFLARFRYCRTPLEAAVLFVIFVGTTSTLQDGTYLGTMIVDLILFAVVYFLFWCTRMAMVPVLNTLYLRLRPSASS